MKNDMGSIIAQCSSGTVAVYYVEEYFTYVNICSHYTRCAVSSVANTEASDSSVRTSSTSIEAEAGVGADISYSSEVKG